MVRTQSSRARRAAGLLTAAAILAVAGAAASSTVTTRLSRPAPRHQARHGSEAWIGAPADGARTVQRAFGPARVLAAGGLVVSVPADGGTATLGLPDGTVLTSFPVALSWLGRPAVATRAVTSGAGWIRVEERDGPDLLDVVTLSATAHGIVVGSAARPPTPGAVSLLSDGRSGLDLRRVTGVDSPAGDGAQRGWPPAVSATGWQAFTPAPLDIQLGFPTTWMGIGLVDVPAATSLVIDRSGGVRVDYPAARQGTDLGAGVAPDGLLRFARIVLTRAPDPSAGLAGYHAALTELGTAPPASRAGPDWWREPICDTWGEQVVDGTARASAQFGTTWLTGFLDGCRTRLGTSHFTLVVDARWQQSLGEPTPRATFGGAGGLRALVDSVHSAGGRVLLWWPLWVEGAYAGGPPGRPLPAAQTVDPTVPGFAAATAARMRLALGVCAGCLDADGLKIDWEYEIPVGLRHGAGLQALHTYLAAIHDGAGAVRPDALMDASSPAPQFLSVTDAVRLDDVTRPGQWDARARMVAAVDPGTLIDADGWVARSPDGPRHLLDGAVYGIPALYYVTRWADGAPVGASPGGLPAVLQLSAQRSGAGSATEGAGGLWTWRGADGSALVELSGVAVLWLPAGAGCGVWRTASLAALTTTTVTLPSWLTGPPTRQTVTADQPAVVRVRVSC